MNITEEILETIIALCNPAKVILYGEKHSVCNQQLKSADFCIILDNDEVDTKLLLRNLYLTIDFDIPINFLIYTEKEWAELTADYSSFASSISTKGTVLYEKVL